MKIDVKINLSMSEIAQKLQYAGATKLSIASLGVDKKYGSLLGYRVKAKLPDSLWRVNIRSLWFFLPDKTQGEFDFDYVFFASEQEARNYVDLINSSLLECWASSGGETNLSTTNSDWVERVERLGYFLFANEKDQYWRITKR